jgi:hypothetical protein
VLGSGRLPVVVMVLGLWLALAPRAHAAPGFSPPSGWADGAAADDEARRRADAWAQAWGADVRQVFSTRADDGFAETLAILDVAAPIPVEALADLDAGRTWLEPRVTEALGPTATLEPDGLELRARSEPGVAVLRGRVRLTDRIAHVAVAPTGARHLAVVLLLPEAEEVLYRSVFDDAVGGLSGLRRPVAPLRRGLLRAVALLSWLLVGSGLAVVWTRRSLPHPGVRVAGRQAAAALLVAAVLVLLLAGSLLGDSTVELALAGSTPWGFALELALGGLAMAVLVLAGTELWERRLEPVASAPESGTYARSSTAPHRTASSLPRPAAPALRPVVTGDTHKGPPPAVTGDTHKGPPPAVTGDTQVGPPPAVTGDTQIGPPPAVTGHTRVGPAPRPVSADGGPPVREVIAGDIEVQTQVRRIHEPDTVKTIPPRPPAVDPSADEDTNPRAVPSDGPPSVAGPRDARGSVPSVPAPRDGRSSVPSVPAPRDGRSSVPSVPAPRDGRSSVPSVPTPRDGRSSVPPPRPRTPRVGSPASVEPERPGADEPAPAREARLPKLEIDWS